MRTVLLLVFVCCLGGLSAQAQRDWTTDCDTVSHFGELVAAARDENLSPVQAAQRAGAIMGGSEIITPDVASEVTRQVFEHTQWSAQDAGVILRSKCLTPIPSSNEVQEIHTLGPLRPIPLRLGGNEVVLPKDRVSITLTWEDLGRGHGRDVFSVTRDGIRIHLPDGYSMADDPAEDVDMRRSLRFARGVVDGEETILLLVAQRAPGVGATATAFRVYELAGGAFTPIVDRPLGRFCNADLALSKAASLPMRQSYKGRFTANGC